MTQLIQLGYRTGGDHHANGREEMVESCLSVRVFVTFFYGQLGRAQCLVPCGGGSSFSTDIHLCVPLSEHCSFTYGCFGMEVTTFKQL